MSVSLGSRLKLWAGVIVLGAAAVLIVPKAARGPGEEPAEPALPYVLHVTCSRAPLGVGIVYGVAGKITTVEDARDQPCFDRHDDLEYRWKTIVTYRRNTGGITLTAVISSRYKRVSPNATMTCRIAQVVGAGELTVAGPTSGDVSQGCYVDFDRH